MSKSRSFSVYLLKEGFDAESSLKEGHPLSKDVSAQKLPTGGSLFTLGHLSQPPWWEEYFGIQSNITPATKGAIIFVPINGRCFAFSFGHVFHNLKNESYEYDFGLRVTLNSIAPDKLKSTDTFDPSVARRQRTQVPAFSDLTYFDFDQDSAILKGLTGKVKEEHEEWFKHATGLSSLRISSDIQPEKIPVLCKKLLNLYGSDSYKTTFPGIRNIEPVRDPAITKQLNEMLLDAFRTKSHGLYLTIPDIIDYRDNLYAKFSGEGKSAIYDDIFIDQYYKYLSARDRQLDDISFEDLKNHDLVLVDENGSVRNRYSIFKSLIFDTTLNGNAMSYHLTEGNWYKVEASYIEKLKSFLDPFCKNLPLPEYTENSEAEYNENVAGNKSSYICLDKCNISLTGQTQVEPCDIYCVENDHAVFNHVKKSTVSEKLSHLFNQGTNAIELLKLENQTVENLKSLLREKTDPKSLSGFLKPLEKKMFKVIFAVVTHKDKANKSQNFPLFSRISLMRNIKALQLMGVEGYYGFIPNRRKK